MGLNEKRKIKELQDTTIPELKQFLATQGVSCRETPLETHAS